MFLTLTTFNSLVVRRNFFSTLKDARSFAIEESKVKVHSIDNRAFYGDFKVIIYNFGIMKTSDHLDIPIDVFF